MRIIEIAALENGAHRNQDGGLSVVPDGWAIIPDALVTENFPFGDITTAEINGVMTVTSWIPRETPSAHSPAPAEQRQQSYSSEAIIEWNDSMMTVNEATTQWQYYAAEGSSKADELQAKIVSAKADIRARFPDKGGNSS